MTGMRTPEAVGELTVQAGYTAWAPWYDDDGNPLTALEGPALRAWFGPLSGRRVIDLGAGTGRHASAALEDGASFVVALDPTPAMLERGRTRLQGLPIAWVRHALPQPLPFRDARFDLAILGLVAEHIPDLVPSLAEVARVLASGGRCVLSVLHPDRTAEGQAARFIDPETGIRRTIATYHRTIAEYLAAASAVGLALEGERDLVVPPELAERLPRAAPYRSHKLGWIACWSRPASHGAAST
ncbi:MAG: class I SAM-dependent methyltransferase [Isosphaeraceae bacterium]